MALRHKRIVEAILIIGTGDQLNVAPNYHGRFVNCVSNLRKKVSGNGELTRAGARGQASPVSVLRWRSNYGSANIRTKGTPDVDHRGEK